MQRSHVRRRPLVTLFVAVAAAVLAQIAVLASSASAHDNRPAVTFAPPEVDGTDVTFVFTVNRSVKAIATTVCTLVEADETETVVDCGAASPGATRQEAGFRVSVTGLAGDVDLRVDVTLTDGGTATATEPVTVGPVDPVEPTDARSACEALPGGEFVEQAYWWQTWSCDFEASTTEMVADRQPVFEAFCTADGGIQFASAGTIPGTYTFGCWLI